MSRAFPDIAQVIASRRSVRAFLPRPVPRETMLAAFELAQKAPSNCNIQPWRVFVASGEVRTRISTEILSRLDQGVPRTFDFEYPARFEAPYRQRQIECAKVLYRNMNVSREDHLGRARAARRNFEFFDAPHVAFIFMDGRFGATVALDVGGYLQTLMLAFAAHGIATCAQGSLRAYPDIVRREFAVPDELKLLVGLSFGYEDTSAQVNETATTRVPIDQVVTFAE